MVGWHHQLNGHEFEQTLEDSKGQGGLACCSPWGRKELDTAQQLNNRLSPQIPRSPPLTLIKAELQTGELSLINGVSLATQVNRESQSSEIATTADGKLMSPEETQDVETQDSGPRWLRCIPKG